MYFEPVPGTKAPEEKVRQLAAAFLKSSTEARDAVNPSFSSLNEPLGKMNAKEGHFQLIKTENEKRKKLLLEYDAYVTKLENLR